MTEPVFFLIAGEASGDLLGSRLMRAIKAKLGGKVRFAGIGGPLMQEEGIELLFPHTELMHFGVVEVLRHIPRLLKRIDQTAQEILRVEPAALITIDAPDFCFRVAMKVKKGNSERGTGNRKKNIFPSLVPVPRSPFPIIHYVAPTVWAWRPGRAKKIARFLDHLLALLPFEPPYFTREGLPCSFVGHPVIEGGTAQGSNAIFRTSRHIAADTPLLAVLPGSRTSELDRLLPIFRETLATLRLWHPDLHIVVPTVPHLKDRVAAEIAEWGVPFHIVEGERDKYDAFAASRAALACSGTVALELALARLPAIIAYKVNALTAFLFRPFIRARFANLVNIMHDKMAVPEFIQDNCTAEKLALAADLLLREDKLRQQQIAALAQTAAWLGEGQFVPSERAAEAVLKTVEGSGFRSQGSEEKNLPSRSPNPDPRTPAVLQVLPALITGGVERGTVETTAALVKAGFRAFVASSGGPMAREVEAAGGAHITLPLASKNPFVIYKNIARLSRAVRAYQIDIVHARSRAPAWSAFYASMRAGAFFVTTFHNAYGAGSKLKRLYNSVMGKGARVIAISDFVAHYAERTYGVARDILRVIPRGVDIEAFAAEKVEPARVEALRRAWNLAEHTPVILMPGRFTRWKGQLVLIRALARLERRDFVCVIVGGGKDSSYGREVARAAARAGLEKNVAIFDTCRDMPAAYLLADLVAVPSTRPEGFGRVVIEAQAMGAPVIATDHGGAAETVIPNRTGFLVAPGDADELAQTIDAVLQMPPAERRVLAARAAAHIREHFTTAAMTSKTLAVYRELLQTRSINPELPHDQSSHA